MIRRRHLRDALLDDPCGRRGHHIDRDGHPLVVAGADRHGAGIRTGADRDALGGAHGRDDAEIEVGEGSAGGGRGRTGF
jgi:hypothetical protein